MSSASHWKAVEDTRTGRTYYYHELTRETQWRKPMDLASDEERQAMEEKERKQMDFFSAMEANILSSLSQGVVPGTPKEPVSRKESRKPPVTGAEERPELIRTISTMDESMLSNLIKRQPSYRVMSKEESSGRGNGFSAGDFQSFMSIKDDQAPLDALKEGNSDDSLPELFSYLPDESEGNDDSYGGGFCDSMRSDGGKFNESSLTGFGLTWEETQALKKLASITKEMIDSENDSETFDLSNDSFAKKNGPKQSFAKGNKGMKELPRELDFSDEEEEVPAKPQSFQKAKDRLPRELDFDDSDEDSDTDSEAEKAPAKTKSVRIAEGTKPPKEAEEEDTRPEVKRRNTCGTLYVGTTMATPDKDATIKCVCGVYRSHILSSEHDTNYRPERDPFRVFRDLESEQDGYEISFDSNDTEGVHVPSLEEVCRFYRGVFYKAQMETDCIIMSLIYVERLIKRTKGKLRPRACNWRSLIFSCMILSSKVWDDLSMWNADFSQSCPPGVTFSLQRINDLELAVLNALGFQVKVLASEYAKYYFLLRSMLIKSGLAGGDEIESLNPLDVMGARRLQQVSSQFENLSASKTGISSRSQSLDVHQLSKKNRAKNGQKKVGLEYVVQF